MRTHRIAALAIAIVLPFCWLDATYAAGVYKWKDAEGNVHFSDTPPPSDDKGGVQGQVQELSLQSDFADAKVSTKPPIANPKPNGGASVALDNFTLRLDTANGNHVTIGRAFSGKDCSQGVDVQWNEGVLDLKGKVAELQVADRFRNFGYRFVRGDADGAGMLADLHMDAELLALKFDVCDTIVSGSTYGTGSRAYVRVRWTLHRDGDSEPLYRGISAGAYDAWRPGGGTKDTILKALAAATDNLLGERTFVDVLTGSSTGPALSAAAIAASDVKLAVAYGNGTGSFRGNSEELLRSAVTVRTSRGHGSGVLIDPAGFALTNAHVVGGEAQVQVIVDDEPIPASVVRSDRRADVALLKFDAKGRRPASVARNEPHPGDPLYVVGTPLSLKLSHTVTQGILSGVREIDGARLFQTDAAVNPGNSGGPVFNDAGELVALSVSGLVNAEGASLNVNYLIPVGRALAAVGAIGN